MGITNEAFILKFLGWNTDEILLEISFDVDASVNSHCFCTFWPFQLSPIPWILILTDSINVWLSIWSAGTCSIGLTSRNSLQCCSPPPFTRLTGFISYGISFRLRAIEIRIWLHLLKETSFANCSNTASIDRRLLTRVKQIYRFSVRRWDSMLNTDGRLTLKTIFKIFWLNAVRCSRQNIES